nr:hypothetical protein [uncultured Pseudodesulfovibrio sp.]
MGLGIAIFSAFAVSRMGHPFELDESCSILKAQFSFENLINYLKNDGHTPLYYLQLKAWLWMFGLSEISARMFSLLTQLGAAVLLFLHGRLILRSSWAGAFAVILFLMGTTTMKTALFVKMYPLMALLTALSIILTQLAVTTGKRIFFILTALTICAASFTNSMFFFVVIGLIVASAIHGRMHFLRVIVSCVAGLVPYMLLWLPIAMGQAHNGSIDWIRQSTLMDPIRDIYNLFRPATLFLPLIVIVAVDSTGFSPWRRVHALWRTLSSALTDKQILFPVIMFGASFGAFCATSFLVKPLLAIPRYGIIFLPMLSIAGGALMAHLKYRRLTAVLLGSLMIASLIPYPTNPRYPFSYLSEQSVLDVEQAIAVDLQPGDLIVSIGQSYQPLKLYLETESAPRHTHMALPRDVEVHPGWNRYKSHWEKPHDLLQQWEDIFATIQREKPRRVYVLSCRSRSDKWFVDRFNEHMELISSKDFRAQSWFVDKLYVFTPNTRGD